jgi:hypothetical protein
MTWPCPSSECPGKVFPPLCILVGMKLNDMLEMALPMKHPTLIHEQMLREKEEEHVAKVAKEHKNVYVTEDIQDPMQNLTPRKRRDFMKDVEITVSRPSSVATGDALSPAAGTQYKDLSGSPTPVLGDYLGPLSARVHLHIGCWAVPMTKPHTCLIRARDVFVSLTLCLCKHHTCLM